VLGGVAEMVAEELAKRTGKEARSLVLGHLQRGGGPTTYDRLLALRFGAAAVRFIAEGARSGMVGVRGGAIELVSLDVAAAGIKLVPVDSDTVVTAREMGLCFGDEPPGHFRSRTDVPPPPAADG
jgi:6-phosphofructokinase 1